MAQPQTSPTSPRRSSEDQQRDAGMAAQDLRHLKEWLGKQPHLPAVDDDVWLERFLYGCKNRLSRCKEVLDMYFTVRGAVPEFFKNRDPAGEDIRLNMETVFVVPLTRLSPQGYRVTVEGLLDTRPDRLDALAYLRRCFMILDAHMKLQPWYGDVVIVDLRGVTWAHLSKFTPTLLKKFFVCSMDAFPVSVKGIHFINSPAIIDKFISMMKPFLKEKIRDRVYAHVQGIEGMYDHLPVDMLPDEYGGTAGSIKELNYEWQKRIETYRDWFLAEEMKMAEESKRPRKQINTNELFGIEGSFRQLIID